VKGQAAVHTCQADYIACQKDVQGCWRVSIALQLPDCSVCYTSNFCYMIFMVHNMLVKL